MVPTSIHYHCVSRSVRTLEMLRSREKGKDHWGEAPLTVEPAPTPTPHPPPLHSTPPHYPSLTKAAPPQRGSQRSGETHSLLPQATAPLLLTGKSRKTEPRLTKDTKRRVLDVTFLMSAWMTTTFLPPPIVFPAPDGNLILTKNSEVLLFGAQGLDSNPAFFST